MNVLEEWAEIADFYRKSYDLTHVGMYPKRGGHEAVVWGLQEDDDHLLVLARGSLAVDPPMRVNKSDWEQMTTWSPPWPWADNGETMVIPATEQT